MKRLQVAQGRSLSADPVGKSPKLYEDGFAHIEPDSFDPKQTSGVRVLSNA